MKLSLTSISLFLLSVATTNGQTSDPECLGKTEALVASEPVLTQGEADYEELVIATMEANCFEGDEIKQCSFGFGQGDLRDAYIRECVAAGGVGWQYTFGYQCDGTSNEEEANIRTVVVCVSGDCAEVGVNDVISKKVTTVYIEPYESRNFTCGSTFTDQEPFSGELTSSELTSSGATAGLVFGQVLGMMALVSFW